MDLISIVMPVHNGEKYLNTAIESILNQTYVNKEIIIVDDCSTDQSFKIANSYNNPKIRVYRLKNNLGQSAASNYGIEKSNGKYIKLFDADDILNKEHLADQYNAIKNLTGCVAAGQINRFFNNDTSKILYEPAANWCDLKPIEWLLIDNGKGLGMMQCAMFLFPREIINRSEHWNIEISMMNDFEFFPRLLLIAEKIIFTETAHVYYRSGNKDSLSNHFSKKALQSAYLALNKTTDLILSKEDSLRSRKILADYWNDWIYHFYPCEWELYKKSEEKLFNLIGQKFTPKNKSIKTSILNSILGWKRTKKLKYFLKTLQ